MFAFKENLAMNDNSGRSYLTAADLCSGIGGFNLAAAHSGIATLFACDNGT